MSRLVEVTHVTLGGEIGSPDAWAFPYLDEEFGQHSQRLLDEADALLLGRVTYEGLSIAYTKMAEIGTEAATTDFVTRMNAIPKFVATTTLGELTWNAERIDGDVAAFVEDLKGQKGQNLLRYGNGILDVTLIEHRLIDEFHLFLTPVAVGKGKHLFESIVEAPHLNLIDVTRFDSGVLALVYEPKQRT